MDDDAPRADAGSPAPLRAIARHPWRVALAVLALAIALLLVFWDWNWFKGPVERIVEAHTGRSLEIGGDLDVDLGRTIVVRAGRLRFGNAPWSKTPRMATAQRVEIGVEFWPLLRREVRLPLLRLTGADLLLERNARGEGNWDFLPDTGEPSRVRYGRLWIDAGHLRFRDPAQNTDIAVDLQSAQPDAAGAAPPVQVDGGGRWRGARFEVEGRAESPLALRDRAAPFHLEATATAGATRARARGTLLDPLRLRDFDLRFALSGRSLADLYPLMQLALPESPPYAFDGRLTRDVEGKLTTWHYDDFKGKVGDSDLAGDAAVTVGGARPFLQANLVSRTLDFDDLAVFVNKAPKAGRGETTNAELAAQAAREAASPRVLPDTPYDLAKLRAMDADVRWKAHRLAAPKLPLDDMDVHLLLDDGLLRLEPADFGVAGGRIRGTVRMDARESPIRTRARASLRGLDLDRLLPEVESARDAVGRVGGEFTLAGTGNSIAKMLGSADGSVALGMGKGEISNLVMELAGLDIEEALKFLVTGDKRIPIRCAFGDFAVQGGVMRAQSLAFDTTDTMIVGAGTISLRDETFDLTLRPRPKDRSLFVLRSPLLVSGTFKDPSFRPDLKRVGLRGAIALTLGSIAPPAALLATIETGPGEDLQCGGRYAK